jgi:hypothetical protein
VCLGQRGVEIDAAPAELRAVGPAQADTALGVDRAARPVVVDDDLVEQRVQRRAWIGIRHAAASPGRRQPSRHSQVCAVRALADAGVVTVR